MPDLSDDDLACLFDEARHALPAGDFAERVANRIRSARRRRALWRGAAWLLVCAGAAAASPYVVQGSLVLAARVERWLPDLGGALVSPAGWVCSMLFALWILRRAKVLRR
jgi:hypothetical protein